MLGKLESGQVLYRFALTLILEAEAGESLNSNASAVFPVCT